MKTSERKAQILRIQSTSFHPALSTALEAKLRQAVVGVTKAILEAALVEELSAERERHREQLGRRSGYFTRVLDTEQGRIEQLRVPKLRRGNKTRSWQILERYHRGVGSLMNFTLSLYVMGLSLRDLQEALYHLLGSVLSVSAINRITIEAQSHMDAHRQAKLVQTPPILVVDGVWVDIQYTSAETKVDRAGHVRQVRHAEERVVLTALAVWPDGNYETLHYEIAEQEDTKSWATFFEHLIERGLDPAAVELVVSDGTLGLPVAMSQHLPQAKQQRCITHKVRRIKAYLSYAQLPVENEQGQPLKPSEAKQQRRYQIQSDAYDIYKAEDEIDAQQRLAAFIKKWQSIEPKAVSTFKRDIELTFSFYQFAQLLHPRIRTSNLIERLFEEFRRKSDEMGAFPNEQSCLTVFFLVVQREHAKHQRSNMAKN
ncbi:MAG: transposase [Cyanobacteria bacterium J06555_13]